MHKYLFLFTLFFLISCSRNEEKDKLIETYKKLHKVINSGTSEEIYEHLDAKSKAYVDFINEGGNQEFEVMKKYGQSVGYPLFTMVYHNHYIKMLTKSEIKLQQFVLFLRFSEVPMFNAFQKSKILEDQISTGNDNYVTIALEVGKNTFVSSKLKFTKEDGKYKFNLLEMLNFSEKKFNQQFKKYAKKISMQKFSGTNTTYKKEVITGYPDDLLKSFLENMDKPENELKELRYRE
jgi:hypothetical protein